MIHPRPTAAATLGGTPSLRLRRLAPVALVLLTLLAPLGPTGSATAAPARAADLLTRFALVVGNAGDPEDGSGGTLIVPGAVIPVGSRLLPPPPPNAPEEERAHNLSVVADRLAETLRLSTIDIRYRSAEQLAVGRTHELPQPAATSPIRPQVTLTGFNDRAATYRVVFRDGAKILTDTSVTIERGQRSVVGGLGGQDTPYMFLVIEPAARNGSRASDAAEPYEVEGDVVAPRAITKLPPQYTEEGRKNGTTGVVVVQAVIDETGRVTKAKILRDLEDGLGKQALEAVRQWRFEPALLDGEPVAVYYNLTINFRLD